MGLLELLVLRLGLWVGLPLLLFILLIGPGRAWRATQKGWQWLWQRHLPPEEILAEIVEQHQKHIDDLRHALGQSEGVERSIQQNLDQSEAAIAALETEARNAAAGGDDAVARATLYRLNLERQAVQSFREQLDEQRRHVAEARRQLFLLELQLRQYEVGRNILLSQLAQAKTLEQQYAIARRFDPFNAVADWQQAEGMVQEKAMNVRAGEHGRPARGQHAADSLDLDAQLAQLKAQLGNNGPADGSKQ
jgi:phage shock protein A